MFTTYCYSVVNSVVHIIYAFSNFSVLTPSMACLDQMLFFNGCVVLING